MYLTQGLHRALQQHPDRTAVLFGGQRRTFSELADRVARLEEDVASLRDTVRRLATALGEPEPSAPASPIPAEENA